MRRLKAWLLRLAATVWRRHDEHELDDEIRCNLELSIDDHLRAGMSAADARRKALLQFGSMEAAREGWRDQKRIPWLEVLMTDLRYALRMLRKSPVFAATVVLVLALGIGGNVAIFSIVNAALIRPLPYASPERLMLLWGNVQRVEVERRGASLPDYRDWSEQSRSFDGIASFWSTTMALSRDEELSLIPAEVVGSHYFTLLGIKPFLGRGFRPEEETKPGAEPVVVLSHRFWSEQFGADPQAVGRTINLDSRKFTVVGILPSGFLGLSDQAQMFLPAGALLSEQSFSARGSRWFAALARLKEGVTREQAQAEMNSISKNLEAAYPESNAKRGVEVAPLTSETFGNVRPALLALLGAVGMVLLIACANVANLLLVRTETRQAEIALRTALGAGRRQVLRLLLTESLVLSSFGAMIGLAFAVWGARLILAASPIQLPSFVNVTVDRDVILFAVFLAVMSAVCMGLAPALQAQQANLYDTLKAASNKTTGSASRRRFRSALIVSEVALTFVLLLGAGLFIESFRRLSNVDPGFRTDHLLTAQFSATGDRRLDLNAVTQALAALPGVQAVTMASNVPFTGAGAIFYTAEGQPAVDATNVPRAYVHLVSSGYFRTMGIPLLSGRAFDASEAESSVIVSESVTRRFWPGQEAIGKRIKRGSLAVESPWLNIVGVVGETKTRGLPDNPTGDPDLYFPITRAPQQVAAIIRTAIDPADIVPPLRNEMRHVDKLAVISNISTMDALIQPLTARSHFISWLTGMFSIIALLLTLIGIYGTMSYAVAQRTREIGIRLALGASARGVLQMVLGGSMKLIGLGLLVGAASGIVIGRSIRDLLFGVTVSDPMVFGVAALLVIAAGAAAAIVPATRAIRIDPIRALREE